MSSKRGILVIISSPSGAGKTTLARRLLAEFDSMAFSISYTTRAPRPNETDGVDYRFVDDDVFEAMIERGEFAEWAHVHGNRYGTSRRAVEKALVEGRDVVFDVDGQGGRALHGQFPADALMIFILPPSLEALQRRLKGRATDAPEVIERRLAKAIEELAYHREYAARIINDDLDQAYALLRAIYLVRRRAQDAPSECAGIVAANDEVANRRYAEQLISDGNKSG